MAEELTPVTYTTIAQWVSAARKVTLEERKKRVLPDERLLLKQRIRLLTAVLDELMEHSFMTWWTEEHEINHTETDNATWHLANCVDARLRCISCGAETEWPCKHATRWVRVFSNEDDYDDDD